MYEVKMMCYTAKLAKLLLVFKTQLCYPSTVVPISSDKVQVSSKSTVNPVLKAISINQPPVLKGHYFRSH